MTFNGTKFFSAVLITSRHAERLATFYKEIVGIPLESEQHGNTAKHYGCEMGDLHLPFILSKTLVTKNQAWIDKTCFRNF